MTARVGAVFHAVVDGLGFPEGPVALEGGRLAFVDMRLQTVFLLSDLSIEPIAVLAGSPNGATLGSDGALYLANNGGVAPVGSDSVWLADPPMDGCIQRLTFDGRWDTVKVGALPGTSPHRPNDLCFGPDGWLYFTDPHNWEVLQSKTPDESRYGGGRVCRTNLRGETELLAELPGFPNGLAFTPDGSELVVAQTVRHRLVALRPSHQGTHTTALYCDLPPTVNPDGMCFDTDGYLYVAGSAGDTLAVIDPDRRIAEVIDLGPGTCPTNVCLEPGHLWVTLGLGRAVGFLDTTSLPHPLAAGSVPT